jgi:hypothetical protein
VVTDVRSKASSVTSRKGKGKRSIHSHRNGKENLDGRISSPIISLPYGYPVAFFFSLSLSQFRRVAGRLFGLSGLANLRGVSSQDALEDHSDGVSRGGHVQPLGQSVYFQLALTHHGIQVVSE